MNTLSGREPTFLLLYFAQPTFPKKESTLVDPERTKALIQRIVSSEGLELVELVFKGSLNHRILRIYIDKPQGITHQDCQRVSDQVGTELDIEDLIPGAYTLEVSSPGLTRKLGGKEDFERYQGRLVKLQTRLPIGESRTFRGILTKFDGQNLTLALKGNQTVEIPFAWVSKANLDIDF